MLRRAQAIKGSATGLRRLPMTASHQCHRLASIARSRLKLRYQLAAMGHLTCTSMVAHNSDRGLFL
jgi:hypothetical protein